MKEHKLYECEFCHTKYADPKVAEKCEKNHKKAKKIVNLRYLPIKNEIGGYPDRVEVEFEDGKKIMYKR